MITSLLRLDEQLFLSINHLPHNIFLDLFFSFFTLIGYFGFVWGGLAYYFYRKKLIPRKKFILLLTFLGLILILVEVVLKNLIGRLRPEFIMQDTIVPLFKPSLGFSFPSGHAVSSFFSAYFLGSLEKLKTKRGLFYLLAAVVSFSRIYLGKHYPSDVLAGALIGLSIGWCCTNFKFHPLTDKRK